MSYDMSISALYKSCNYYYYKFPIFCHDFCFALQIQLIDIYGNYREETGPILAGTNVVNGDENVLHILGK